MRECELFVVAMILSDELFFWDSITGNYHPKSQRIAGFLLAYTQTSFKNLFRERNGFEHALRFVYGFHEFTFRN